MTIPVSTAPAAQAYLLSAIQTQVNADPLNASMLVRLGEVGQWHPNDIIVVGDVHRTVKPETFIGSGAQYWLNEDYTVAIEINTWAADGDTSPSSTNAIQVNNRAWQLLAYVETAVRNDPSLGGLVNIAYPKEAISAGPAWTAGPVGLLVGITCPISVSVLN